MKIFRFSTLLLAVSLIFAGCASKKRKDKDPSLLGKFYHNTTAYYNGFFNAEEIMEATYLNLEASNRDNFNDIISVYDYDNAGDGKGVAPEMDRAIEKVTRVAELHPISKWVDDCYVLMGEAQYLKQDYESAEETFAYFKEEFDPANPFGRNYQKKKKSKKEIKKQREKERAEKKKEIAEEKKEQKKEREQAAKEREKEQNAKKKERERERKAKERAREEEKKRRAKEKKNSKRKKRKGGKKKRPAKKEDKKEETNKEETSPTTEVEKEEASETVTPEKVDTSREELEEEDADEEEVEEQPEDETNPKDKTAYTEGMVWYAKTLVQRDKYSNAEYLLIRLQEEWTLSNKVLRDIPVVLADIAIKEKNYPKAIGQLDLAIERGNSNKLKSRYSFIQGQLYQKLGDANEATYAFERSKKWAKSFDLEFMAELNNEKSAMMSGQKTRSAVVNKLDKMAGEFKYLEYQDQIYYTKGEILLADGNVAEALESFRKSAKFNTSNAALKQETYYLIASLFYERENYIDAKSYYDSTYALLSEEHEYYREVKNLSESLTDIAKNIAIIEMQDSLLQMVNLSDTDIRKMAEQMVEDEEAAAAAAAAAGDSDQPGQPKKTFGGSFGASDFFAYNEISKQKGKATFLKTWGDIDLQDDWRRQNRASSVAITEDNEEEKVAEDGYKEEAVERMVAEIKRQIPYSDKQKSAANVALELAFFELGKSFRDKIQRYDNAVETHETLLKRFPNFDQKLDVYYYLFLSNLDIPNQTRAEYYKNKILTEYPNTEYAKILDDPNYAVSLIAADKKLENFYDETYENFQAGKHELVLTNVEAAEQVFGADNDLAAKFDLLKAMATGNVKGKDEYIKALRIVTRKYPDTPEKIRAQEILRFLGGDNDAFVGVSYGEEEKDYKFKEDALHYAIVVMYNPNPEQVQTAQLAISNYNKKYRKLDKLQSSTNALKPGEIELVFLRSYDGIERAMSYYDEVVKAEDEYLNTKFYDYEVFVISNTNFRELLKQKEITRYRRFFEENYLGN